MLSFAKFKHFNNFNNSSYTDRFVNEYNKIFNVRQVAFYNVKDVFLFLYFRKKNFSLNFAINFFYDSDHNRIEIEYHKENTRTIKFLVFFL